MKPSTQLDSWLILVQASCFPEMFRIWESEMGDISQCIEDDLWCEYSTTMKVDMMKGEI